MVDPIVVLFATAVLAVIAFALSVYAFFKLRGAQGGGAQGASLVDLEEFKDLNGEIKGLYKDRVVKGMSKSFMAYLNRLWEQLSYNERQNARENLKTIESGFVTVLDGMDLHTVRREIAKTQQRPVAAKAAAKQMVRATAKPLVMQAK